MDQLCCALSAKEIKLRWAELYISKTQQQGLPACPGQEKSHIGLVNLATHLHDQASCNKELNY